MSTQTAERRPLTVWLDRGQADELERRAKRNERSVSGELRLAIAEHLERRVVVHAPPDLDGEAA